MFEAEKLEALSAALALATSNPQRFVLLFEWAEHRVGELENTLNPKHQSGLVLQANPQAAVAITELVAACLVPANEVAVAEAVLVALTSLDDALGSIAPSVLAKIVLKNQKGESCALARHDLFPLAKPSRTSSRNQGGSIRSYARRHGVLPVSGNVLLSSALVETNQTGVALEQAVVGGRLLAVPIGNPLAVQVIGSVALVTVALGVTEEEQAETLVRGALKRASNDQVTVLVLPELSLPEGLIEGPNGLRKQLGGTFPVLVVSGLHHHEFDDGKIRNRSVIVDAEGEVLHSHFKLTRVNFSPTGRGPKETVEGHQTGSTLTVHPSPLGSICIPICRDSFAMESKRLIEDSGCTLLLVPSLSPDTKEHETGLQALRGTNHLSALVCNRWLTSDINKGLHPLEGESCLLIPGASSPLKEFTRGGPNGVPLEVTWP
jgi:predicted amidohydrolase